MAFRSPTSAASSAFSGLMAGCSFVIVLIFDPRRASTLARHGVTQATAGTAFHQAHLAVARGRHRGRRSAPSLPGGPFLPGGGAPKPPQLHFDVKEEMVPCRRGTG
jgi:hypothetical protein